MSIIKKIVFWQFKNLKRTSSSKMQSKRFKLPYTAEEDYIDKFKILTISRDKKIKKHIIFFHGGGYILEPAPQHVNVVKKLCDLGYKVSYVDYPLAPEYKAEKNLEVVLEAYKKIRKKYKDDTFYFLGDSAGGGLAVVLLRMLKDKGFKDVPRKTVLISPWVDISMSNPKLKNQEKSDKLFSSESLLYASNSYAGTINLKDERLSPIYGDLSDLGEILVTYSEREILKPDIEEFIRKVKMAKNSSVTVVKEEKGVHDYVVYVHTKKSKRAFEKIVRFLEEREN